MCKPVLLFVLTLFLVACSPVISPDQVSGPPLPPPLESTSRSPTVRSDFPAVESYFGGVPFLDQLAFEQYSEEAHMNPGQLDYLVVMENSRDVIEGYVWCTTTLDILEENWANIRVTMELNGRPIHAQNMNLETYLSGEVACNFLTVLLTDWPPGQHQWMVKATFRVPLNDGFDDYPAGSYIEAYTILVGD